MEYIGKLYAKVGGHYIETNLNSSDIDELQKPNKQMVINLIGLKIQKLLESNDKERFGVKEEIKRLQKLHKVCQEI